MASVDRSKSVKAFALQSRLFIALIQIFFNYLIPDHDAKVFNPPTLHKNNAVDHAVTFLLGGFRRWDAIYFLHVAEHGYTYENTLAFFPLFPLLTRFTANTVLLPLQFVMNYSNCLLIAAFIINLLLFIISADALYRLSVKVLSNEAISYKAAQLYCVNPASVFFSAPYSETTFALFTFSGMLSLENGNLLLSSLLFGMGSLARSNGLVNCAFIWYMVIKDLQKTISFQGLSFQRNPFTICVQLFLNLFFSVCKAVIVTFLCWLPFLVYQYCAYKIFCNPLASYTDIPSHILNYGNDQKYKMAHTGLSKWCHHSVPMSYSYVQSNHWNVGFLSYYELKQIPNFLLALPVICLSTYTVISYVTWNPLFVLSLGLYDPLIRIDKKVDDEPSAAGQTLELGTNKKSCLVYIFHLASLTVFGSLFMHIQVLTRFIFSSSPIIYWFIASITVLEDDLHSATKTNHSESNGVSDVFEKVDTDISWNDKSWFCRIVLIYFHLYLFVGVAAFSNFLPWT